MGASPTKMNSDGQSPDYYDEFNSPALGSAAKPTSAHIKRMQVRSAQEETLYRSQTIKKQDQRTQELLKALEESLSIGEDIKQIIKEKFRLNIVLEGAHEIRTQCSKQEESPENSSGIEVELEAVPIDEESSTQQDYQQFDMRESFSGTQNYPSSVHGVVKVSRGGKNYWASGILIASDIVLTAAHNIYHHSEGTAKKFDNIQFIPAMNGKQAPFGVIDVVESYVPQEFLDNKETEDYGILVLSKPVGNQTGYFGLHVAPHVLFKHKELSIVGYPADKVSGKPGSYEQWSTRVKTWWSEDDERNQGKGLLQYKDLCTPGQDGAGIYYYDNDNNEYCVIGVHTRNLISDAEIQTRAVQITKDRFRQIQQWTLTARCKQIAAKKLKMNGSEINLLYKNFGDEGIQVLLEHGMPNVKKLNLSSNRVTDRSSDSLKSLNSFNDLEELTLAGNLLSTHAGSVLAQNTSWRNLKVLSLGSNKLGNNGVCALAKNTSWHALENLALFNNQIGDVGATELASNNTWKKLTVLSLHTNQIGDIGARAIAANTSWANLQKLYLDSNNIGDDGALAIGENRTWANLQSLFLSTNQIGENGAIAIGKSTIWINLESLYLNHNKIGNEGAKSIGENKTWKKLKMFSLGSNMIGKDGATAIENNTTWSELKDFNFSRNPFGDITWTTNGWQNVKALMLYFSEIGDDGAESIGADKNWKNLELLYLEGNKIGPKGAKAISENTTWKKLKMLLLHLNHIGNEGAVAIANNTTWVDLEILWLSHNQIGNEGAEELGKNTTWKNLKTLKLDYNIIGDKGVIGLTGSTVWTKLKELDLAANNIGDQGVEGIRANKIWDSLRVVNVNSNPLITPEGFKKLKEERSAEETEIALENNNIQINFQE